jgi:hypothetical protein
LDACRAQCRLCRCLWGVLKAVVSWLGQGDPAMPTIKRIHRLESEGGLLSSYLAMRCWTTERAPTCLGGLGLLPSVERRSHCSTCTQLQLKHVGCAGRTFRAAHVSEAAVNGSLWHLLRADTSSCAAAGAGGRCRVGSALVINRWWYINNPRTAGDLCSSNL